VKLTGSYAVYQNGLKIAHGSPVRRSAGGQFFGDPPPVRLRHKPSRIRFVLTGARRGKPYALSTAFKTVWTWRSAPRPDATLPPSWYCTFTFTGFNRRCAVQPLMTLDYHVHGLSPHETTPPGQQSIGLSVGHLQLGGHAKITGATAQFSINGGKTWQAATVTRAAAGAFTISFTAPTGTAVTLRTHATDTAGGSITETIHNAYRTS
jgi:hypothetical protein